MSRLCWAFASIATALLASRSALAVLRDADPRVLAAHAKAMRDFPVCSKAPTPTDVDTARAAHKQATKYVEGAEYEKAILAWKSAYGFDCTRPSVFINLANAYEPSDKAMAVAMLQIYEERDPAGGHGDVDARIASIEQAMGPPPLDAKPKADAAPGAPSLAQPMPPERRPFGAAPLVVAVLGGGALLWGVPALVLGRVRVNQAIAQCGGKRSGCSQPAEDLGNSGNALTAAGIGLLAGGGAFATAGIIWQLVGNQLPSAGKKSVPLTTKPIAFVPFVSPGLAGGLVVGAF